jgi:hypothetical protein
MSASRHYKLGPKYSPVGCQYPRGGQSRRFRARDEDFRFTLDSPKLSATSEPSQCAIRSGRVPTSKSHSLDVEQQKAAVLNSVRRLSR